MQTLTRTLFFGLSVTVCASSAWGQTGVRVAIAAAASSDLTDCRYVGLQQKLQQTGKFALVDIVDVVSTTPLFQNLQSFDAVITWSSIPYADSDAMGDTLATYVDGGGGVVVAGFANYTTSIGQFLGGRWLTGGYEIIEHTAGLQSGAATLGAVLDPTHPIAQNVANISAMFAARPFLGPNWALAQGSVILEWNDGRMMVAVSDTTYQRVDLGLHPVDSDCVSGYLDASSDGVTLIANALIYAAGGSIATNYCTAAPNSTGMPARIVVEGSTAVSDNDITLNGVSLPANTFGFFFGGQARTVFPGFGGGQGVLCVQSVELDARQYVQSSGALGRISLVLDLTTMPTLGGTTSVVAGETWNFQAWFRDANPQPTSNLTDGATVLFQ